MKLKKAIYITIGCIGLALGAVGAVLPLLHAFPFLLLAAICFGKSSERLDRWFKNTKLYKNNLESFVKGQGLVIPKKRISRKPEKRRIEKGKDFGKFGIKFWMQSGIIIMQA